MPEHLFGLPLDHYVRPPQAVAAATAATPLPVYHIHSFEHPFCADARCPCQQHRQEAERLFVQIIEGHLELKQASAFLPAPEQESQQPGGARGAPGLLAVSPALEVGCTVQPSTCWLPLDELVLLWMDTDTLLLPVPIAPLLAAIAHALFALSRESRASRLYTLAWQQQVYAAVSRRRSRQTVRHLQEAARHWSRAALLLDAFQPAQHGPSGLERARQLARIARTQRERLLRLIDEVRAEQAGKAPLDQNREAQA